jgi:hypothetical protein
MTDAEFKARMDREQRELRMLTCVAFLLAFAAWVVWGL